MIRRNFLQAIQAAIISRLLLIIIALMIALLFTVLPIKNCSSASGWQTGPKAKEISERTMASQANMALAPMKGRSRQLTF